VENIKWRKTKKERNEFSLPNGAMNEASKKEKDFINRNCDSVVPKSHCPRATPAAVQS
jgi:hypothetical protein